MTYRNILILLVCQLISATGAIVLVTLGGIIGAKLTPNPALATLPVSIMIISVALTAIPATVLMKKVGRKRGFAMASICAFGSVLLAAYALSVSSFIVFIVAAGLFGINMAFTQQYRYAAAESVDAQHVPRAISFVLLGAIGGALVGPELVKHGETLFSAVQYAGTLGAVSVLYLVQAFLFFALGPMRGDEAHSDSKPQRSLSEIVRQPVFMMAVLGGVTAYGVMTLIMTATPLSMHLIEKLGVVKMMSLGALALLAA